MKAVQRLTLKEQATLKSLQDRARQTGQLHIEQLQTIDSVSATLQERGTRYGDFTYHARIAQNLQDVIRSSIREAKFGEAGGYIHGWDLLSPVQKQALTVIADKIARILSGDANYSDNWHDIQGYAKLVEERLPKCEQQS